MALNSKPISFPSGTSFSDKVLYGVRKALRKLAEETAARGGSLVVKIDGEIKEVPAKELLKTLPEEGIPFISNATLICETHPHARNCRTDLYG